MKRVCIILTLLLLLTGCGEQAQEESEVTDTVVISDTESVTYYYNFNGLYIDATEGIYPVPAIEDLDVWRTVKPTYTFKLLSGDTIYLCANAVDGYSAEKIGDWYIVSESKEAVLTTLSYVLGDVAFGSYEELTMSPTILDATTESQDFDDNVPDYKNADIIMYATATLQAYEYVAVCKQDLGYKVQIIFLQNGDHTCSLRDNGMTLLIEDTGETIPLTWYLNKEYTPVTQDIPENDS